MEEWSGWEKCEETCAVLSFSRTPHKSGDIAACLYPAQYYTTMSLLDMPDELMLRIVYILPEVEDWRSNLDRKQVEPLSMSNKRLNLICSDILFERCKINIEMPIDDSVHTIHLALADEHSTRYWHHQHNCSRHYCSCIGEAELHTATHDSPRGLSREHRRYKTKPTIP